MNNVRSLVQAAHQAVDPATCLGSDQMLAELLALNEEMVEQLCLERLGVKGGTEFISSMIEQHEKAAGLLRAQLAKHRADSGTNGKIVPAGVASSKGKHTRVTHCDSDIRGTQPDPNGPKVPS